MLLINCYRVSGAEANTRSPALLTKVDARHRMSTLTMNKSMSQESPDAATPFKVIPLPCQLSLTRKWGNVSNYMSIRYET